MKKIRFATDVFPHLVAVVVFLVVTVFFFNPIFFENKTLEQYDIQQYLGTSKAISDFRERTGEEPLWTNSVFSGMPAYLISVQWGNQAVVFMKMILGMGLPHPVVNIFIGFVCYYILLLAFGVRPWLAIGGALAFGLSTYLIVGLSAGHNSRIGAIAFLPLVMAGIHLTFSRRRILGFGVVASGLALHLRENHLQMTYYLLLIVGAYGIVRLIEFIREKRAKEFFINVGLLIPASVIAAGTFFGQFWAITEYTKYSIRGKLELTQPGRSNETGLTRDYAFQYKYGILEPMTLLIPEFYGGGSGKFFVQDRDSESYKALVNSGDQQTANQLAQYTSAYWGPQTATAAPYYAGAITVFLFVLGILFADKKFVWWLVPVSVLSIMLSWGDSFPSFNYFMFDYFPGYNKFRSVNFALIIILFSMPLLGFLGIEQLWRNGLDKKAKKKLLVALGCTAGLCLFFILFAGIFNYTRDIEEGLPGWFLSALADDRQSLLRADAFRSIVFIAAVFILLYFDVRRRIAPAAVYGLLALLITIDLAVVNKRYFTEANFKRKRENPFAALTEADKEILRDKSYYRVYNLQGAFVEARTSYHHHSIGGYHGAKMRRYQDLYDSCIIAETRQLYADAQQQFKFGDYGTINMLNVKYIVFGPGRENIIVNDHANGPAWFVREITRVNTPDEELASTCDDNTKTTAVVNATEFDVSDLHADSAASISLVENTLNYLKYQSSSAADGLAVFSEIYYPEGWIATIDGEEATILRANYVLRALEIPAGDHVIEFRFMPRAYTVGNKVSSASSWLVLIVLLGTLGWSVRNSKAKG